MTSQEAIEIIKKDGWGYPENMHTEAVMMAIDALEARIDEKPINNHCPSCGGIVNPDQDKYVCYWCGQWLDWSEVE